MTAQVKGTASQAQTSQEMTNLQQKALRPNTIMEMQGVSKSFSGVEVLHSVDFEVRRGEVHALLGENGAGKSTLMNILAGVYSCDTGQIRWHGRPVRFKTPHEAQRKGISTIYQESSLVPHLTVAENVFLGHEPVLVPGLPFINQRRLHRQTHDLLHRLGLSIDTHAPAASLSAAERRMVEIAKALRHSADLIIMDEPTASLSPAEVDTLFRVIRALTARGVAVVYISHRLEEVISIGDRATILRDGEKVATVPLPDTTTDQLVRLMIGRSLNDKFPHRQAILGDEVLKVERLTRYGIFEDISFTLHAGEIVGITGLMGAGSTSLVRAIFGLDPLDEGNIYLGGKPATINSPQAAIALGIGLLTENREEQGLILDMSISENITLSVLQRDWPNLLIDHSAEQNIAEEYIHRLNIKPPIPGHATRYLSSGMQQKVILSRWLATEARVLIFDQPTRGVDVGGKVEIYRFIAELAERGVATLIVSPELPEILGMCDRVLVLREGVLTASLRGDAATAESVLAYAAGGLPR
jgi:ribose transport system ATP-binding protein